MDEREEGSATTFEAYMEALMGMIGHADRAVPLRDYCLGLMLPVERKSVEPLAAVTAPGQVSAKYAAAMQGRTADPEAILRRFARADVMHPTYMALSELGRAIKMIFLCRYLRHERFRREIHEGLNVVESWNSANGFVFFGKGGEIATNRLEDQEISVLALHLLQASLVYVNTRMMQTVLVEPDWSRRITPDDYRGLTPLTYAFFNPYGRFDLDMGRRIDFERQAA